MKYVIYHNPKCSKSRQTLKILEDAGVDFSVREYLKEPLSKSELTNLLTKLDISASDIIRRKEAIIKEQGIDLSSDSKCLAALTNYPKLLERPIVEAGAKAVIGRPPENVEKLL